jgi:hypothetical protein
MANPAAFFYGSLGICLAVLLIFFLPWAHAGRAASGSVLGMLSAVTDLMRLVSAIGDLGGYRGNSDLEGAMTFLVLTFIIFLAMLFIPVLNALAILMGFAKPASFSRFGRTAASSSVALTLLYIVYVIIVSNSLSEESPLLSGLVSVGAAPIIILILSAGNRFFVLRQLEGFSNWQPRR